MMRTSPRRAQPTRRLRALGAPSLLLLCPLTCTRPRTSTPTAGLSTCAAASAAASAPPVLTNLKCSLISCGQGSTDSHVLQNCPCKSAAYCNQACQKADLSEHREGCLALRLSAAQLKANDAFEEGDKEVFESAAAEVLRLLQRTQTTAQRVHQLVNLGEQCVQLEVLRIGRSCLNEGLSLCLELPTGTEISYAFGRLNLAWLLHKEAKIQADPGVQMQMRSEAEAHACFALAMPAFFETQDSSAELLCMLHEIKGAGRGAAIRVDYQFIVKAGQMKHDE